MMRAMIRTTLGILLLLIPVVLSFCPPPALTEGELPPTVTPMPGTTLVGRSVEGQAIIVQRFGDGPMPVLLVGGIHGGYESNTVVLMNEVGAYFDAHPEDIAPNVSLYVIPAANPDGLRHGRTAEGRFNANGVDLNRNWGCNWSAEAYWREQRVAPGPAAFSEPETQALRDYITTLQPVVVVWYHSAAAGVFAGHCEDDHGSAELARVLGSAAGYRAGAPFDAYEVTGTASDWVDGQGIPAMAVELASVDEPEWARNHAGIMALQCHFAGLAAPGWAGDDLAAFLERACD